MAKGRAEGCDRVEARATGSRRGPECDGETIFVFLGQQGGGQGGDKVTARPWPWQARVRGEGQGHTVDVTSVRLGRSGWRPRARPIGWWCDRATEVGDDTWVPLGSGYGRVKGVLAWASC